MCDNINISCYDNFTTLESSTSMPNISESDNPLPATVYGISSLTLMIVIFITNAFMIFVILRHKEFHNPTNYCLLSLCLGNMFGFVTLAMLAFSVFVIHLQHFLECVASISLYYLQVLIGLLMLLLVAIEKYIMIMYPLRYNTIVTTKRMLGAIVTCWVYTIIIALLPIFGLNTHVIYIFPYLNETEIEAATWGTEQCNPDYELPSSYIGLFFLGNFYPILLCLLCLYSRILMIAHKQARQIESLEQMGQESKGVSFRKYFKSLRTVIAILGYFIITWVPMSVLQLMEFEWLKIEFIPIGRQGRAPLLARILISSMTSLNCVYNPVVCVLLNKDMRQAAKRMLR
ncbi:unnamed protein product, partial [Owenia fusiformis]